MPTKLYQDASDNFRVSIPGGTKDAILPAGQCTLTPNDDASRVTISVLNAALRAISGDFAVTDLTDSSGTPYADYDTLVAAVGSFFRKPSQAGGAPDTPPLTQELKFIGTTASTEGGEVTISHPGVNSNQVLGVDVRIEFVTGRFITVGYNDMAGYEANVWWSVGSIKVQNRSGSSGSILSRPLVVLIRYEE